MVKKAKERYKLGNLKGVNEKMRMLDYKDKICEELCKVLQLTISAADLISLNYDKETEIVTATFENGSSRKINVAWDSGMAMIRDIVNHLGC